MLITAQQRTLPLGMIHGYAVGMTDLALLAILAAAILASIIFTIPAPTIPLIVTACGIVLTWRVASAQRSLAERKLFLDLMQRRAEWYDRVKLALEGRSQERRDHVEVIITGKMPGNPEHLSKLWQLETEAGWLFGKEMVILMANLIEADSLLYGKMMAAREGDFEAAKECGTLAWDVSNKQSRVQDYLGDYLYVGDIGRPKRSPVKFAKEKRRGPLGIFGPIKSTRP